MNQVIIIKETPVAALEMRVWLMGGTLDAGEYSLVSQRSRSSSE